MKHCGLAMIVCDYFTIVCPVCNFKRPYDDRDRSIRCESIVPSVVVSSETKSDFAPIAKVKHHSRHRQKLSFWRKTIH